MKDIVARARPQRHLHVREGGGQIAIGTRMLDADARLEKRHPGPMVSAAKKAWYRPTAVFRISVSGDPGRLSPIHGPPGGGPEIAMPVALDGEGMFASLWLAIGAG